MTVVQYEAPTPLPPSRPGDENLPGPTGRIARLRGAAEYAAYVHNTALVPEPLRGKPDEVAAVILTGEEVGLEPMAALRAVAMIKGVPTFKAEALRGLVTSHGHEMWLEESTNTRAIAAGRRSGTDRVGRVTWTMDDAKRAGISGQLNYTRYPREMLVARASAALARQMFADVVMGLVAAEELDEFVYTPNGSAPAAMPAPEDAPPAEPKQAARRQRTPAKAPAADPPPAQEAGASPTVPTPPPDTQPDPPAPAEPLATDAYKRRIFASMRELGLSGEGDRDERLAYCSRIAGRPIASSNELTIGEASKIIDRLEADKAARAAGERAFLDELRETLDAEPVPEDPPDLAQWERLQALFDEKAIDDRIAYARGVVARELDIVTAMTADEASAVIAHLEQYDPTDPQTWPFPDGF